MPFVPDKPIAQTGGFRPDAPAAPARPHPDEPGFIESTLRGALQGVTLGFSDEIGGGLQAVIDKITGDAGGLQDLYAKERDSIRARNRAAADVHPVLYHGAELAAGLALPVGAAGTVGRMVATGAALGGAAGVGYTEAQTPDEIAKAGLQGVAGGALAGGAGYGLGKLATSAPVTAALDAAGIHAGRTHLRGGVTPLTGAKAPISEEAIRAANEAGAFGGRNIGQSVEALNRGAEVAGDNVQAVVAALDHEGVRSGNLRKLAESWLNQADDIESRTLGSPVPELMRSRARELLQKLDPYGEGAEFVAARDRIAKQLGMDLEDPRLAGIMERAYPRAPRVTDDLALGTAENLKSSMQDMGKYGKLDASGPIQAERGMASDLRRANEVAVEAQAGPEAAEGFANAKEKFSRLEEARTAAKKGEAMYQNRAPIGLSEMVAVATGHPVGALATHAVKTRGYSLAASTLMGTAQRLTQVAKTAPSALGKYAGVLQRAAMSGGEEEVARKHFVLNSTDPEYRQMVTRLTSEGGGHGG